MYGLGWQRGPGNPPNRLFLHRSNFLTFLHLTVVAFLSLQGKFPELCSSLKIVGPVICDMVARFAVCTFFVRRKRKTNENKRILFASDVVSRLRGTFVVRKKKPQTSN